MPPPRSSPALLLSPLQHRLRLRLFPPLLRRLRRGSCLYCCLAYASTQLLQLFSFSCWLSPVLSSKPSHALRSASWHDFSTANLLGSSVRQLGSARLGGSSVRLSARLFLRLGLGDRPLVGAACRLGSSAHLLGPSRRLVQDRPPSSTAPPLRMIILLHRQLRTPSGCAPLRPTPSRCTKTVIRQRNTLQPRLAFDRLRAIEHRSTTSRILPPTTPGCTPTLPLPHRSTPPADGERDRPSSASSASDARARNCDVPVRRGINRADPWQETPSRGTR